MSNDTRFQALHDWLHQLGYKFSSLETISADASARRYFRLRQSEQSFIAVDTPLPQEENQAFVDLAQTLRLAGQRTPQVFHVDIDGGRMLIEDFGDHTFARALESCEKSSTLYLQAMKMLSAIQHASTLRQAAASLPRYNEAMIRRELDFFPRWCLEGHLEIELDDEDFLQLESLNQQLVQVFKEQPQVFIHRDFHSRNLMVLEGAQIGLIDFQGAVQGPLSYDWVSLLRDCYITIPTPNFQTLFQRYLSEASNSQQIPAQQLSRWFDLTGLQRHLKAIGLFCRLKQQDNKPAYMADVPRTFSYVLEASERHQELAPLQRLIAKHKLVSKLL